MSDNDDGHTMVRTLNQGVLASLWQDTTFSDVNFVMEGLEEPS